MPEKCKDCCSRLFCMSVAEVNGEDFEAMANKRECRKRVFTNADRIRSMSDEELAERLIEYRDDWGDYVTHKGTYYSREEALKAEIEWIKQPAE